MSHGAKMNNIQSLKKIFFKSKCSGTSASNMGIAEKRLKTLEHGSFMHMFSTTHLM